MKAQGKLKPPACSWCGRELEASTRGRPKKYCSQSCRQRAYEQRNNVKGTSIPHNAVILHPDRAEELIDKLFELRCSAEDIATAVEEHEDPRDIRQLCNELVDLAKNVEQLRIRE
ncbi:hypothetical protein [Corynebacterium aquilae]|uniref:hypothetical protein n=1 Tax=Corynebacterium aquilae TaxID=203263 RepID=UPI000952DF3F|nr:hypothetical protein [Corynebacterium aquilae]